VKSTFSGGAVTGLVVAVAVATCCVAPLLVAAIAAGTLPLLLGEQQMLLAVLAAAFVTATVAIVTTKLRGSNLPVQIRDAMIFAFAPPKRALSVLLFVLIGTPLTVFYLVALPAEHYGAIAWGALQFLTPGEAIAAGVLGFGTAATLALNVAAGRARPTGTTLTFSGIVAAIVPTSLCCTTVIPSVLAALGASAPAIMHISGRYESFFANYAAGFIGFAVAAVLLAFWLAVGNLTAACSTRSSPMKVSL
jgi:hypothetical protein